MECKPFKRTYAEQLKLVTSFDWIDFNRLSDIEGALREVYDRAGDYVDVARKDAILSAFSTGLQNLMAISAVQKSRDDVAQDVELDLAQEYGAD